MSATSHSNKYPIERHDGIDLARRTSIRMDALERALKACRPEIERQRDRCNSDEEVDPYERLLTQIDAALSPHSRPDRGEGG